MQSQEHQSGQIVLIALLVLTAATTVALSLIGRSTIDVAISSQVEESARALGAAEAGIEEVLKTAAASSLVLAPGVSYNATAASVGGATGVYRFPRKTSLGEIETVWLVDHNEDGTLDETPAYTTGTITICWTSESTEPAMVATILYKKAGNYLLAKGAYDPKGPRRATTKFAGVTATSGGCGESAMYAQLITFSDFGINPASDTLLAVRLRPLYADTQIAVDAPATLPIQGSRIDSTGSASGTLRKVVVYSRYREASGLFDHAVYSQGSFGK